MKKLIKYQTFFSILVLAIYGIIFPFVSSNPQIIAFSTFAAILVIALLALSKSQEIALVGLATAALVGMISTFPSFLTVSPIVGTGVLVFAVSATLLAAKELNVNGIVGIILGIIQGGLIYLGILGINFLLS